MKTRAVPLLFQYITVVEGYAIPFTAFIFALTCQKSLVFSCAAAFIRRDRHAQTVDFC